MLFRSFFQSSRAMSIVASAHTKRCVVQGHRGCPYLEPENTLQVKRCLSANINFTLFRLSFKKCKTERKEGRKKKKKKTVYISSTTREEEEEEDIFGEMIQLVYYLQSLSLSLNSMSFAKCAELRTIS